MEPIQTPASSPEAARWPLPLAQHPFLELTSDFVYLSIVPIAPGEQPFVELLGRSQHEYKIDVRGDAGTTTVRLDHAGHDPRWPHRIHPHHEHHHGHRRDERRREHRREDRWWEGAFWERRFGRHARAHVVAHVPANVRAKVHSAAARVDVARLAGCELTVDLDAGALTLDDIAGRIALSTSAGRIDGRGLRGSIDVSTSAGAVRLELLALDPGTHRIRTNMGAAHVELADGMPVQIDTRTAMGSSRVDAPSTRGAAAILDVEADLGAIRVSRSRRAWTPKPPIVKADGPYRTAAEPQDDAEIAAILAKVADGSLSPTAARDLLRAMGYG
jgi:hypothetical protein